MLYRLEQRIHTLAHNDLDLIPEGQPGFIVEGVSFSPWRADESAGCRTHPYWLATWETETESRRKAWQLFWDKLAIIVPRISLVSQCNIDYLHQPLLILREGYDTAFLVYIKEHKGVGLTFAEEELKALQFFLRSSQIPDEFFWYWNDATNATGYTSKLVLMLVAVEALVNKSLPQGKGPPDKDWDKLVQILGPELKKEFWGEEKNSHNALRHRLAHGRYFGPKHGGINYVDLLHGKIVTYLNQIVLREHLIDEGVVKPQRHPFAGEYVGHSFIRSQEAAKLQLIDVMSDMNSSCDFTKYERIVSQDLIDSY
nr:hypothetical protein [Nitrosomonas nitrosa]